MNYQIAVTPNSDAPQIPKDFLPVTEWSALAIIAVLLIRHVLVIDKAKREAETRLIEKLVEEVFKDD